MNRLIFAILLLLLLAILVTSKVSFVWSLDLVSPLETYEESSGWGPRRLTVGGSTGTFHGGVDLTAPEGTRIRAVAAGLVYETWPLGWVNGIWYDGHPKYGKMVRIAHYDGSFTLYGHLSVILAHEGEHVLAGRSIGVIGNTGISTGRHLHFEHLITPVIPASVEPEDPERARWRRILMGFANAEQEAIGD